LIAHTRVTTMAGWMKDTYALGQWQIRQAVHGIGKRPDLYALACALDPEADKGELQNICEKAAEAAESSRGAHNGSALHAFTERVDRGKPAGTIPGHLTGDVAAYQAGLEREKISIMPDMLERMVIIPKFTAAGTFDRLLTSPHWPLSRVGDLKSAKELKYSHLDISIQMALYAHGTAIWNPLTERYERMPEVDRKTGVVLWLPVGASRFEVWEVDLEAGWEYAHLAAKVGAARKRKDLLRPAGPPVLASIPAAETPRSFREIKDAHATAGTVTVADTYLTRIAALTGPLSEVREALRVMRREGLERGDWLPSHTLAGQARITEIRTSKS
jgi:hypothetical protein